MNMGSSILLSGALLSAVTMTAQAGPHFSFTPDLSIPGAGLLSPEGCEVEAGFARGLLTGSARGSYCRSGLMGSQAEQHLKREGPVTDEATSAATFVTARLTTDLPIGGLARLVVYFSALRDGSTTLSDELVDATIGVLSLEELGADGESRLLASVDAFEVWNWAGVTPATIRAESLLSLPSETARAGTRLRVIIAGDLAPDVRLIYGDAPLASIAYPNPTPWESFADAGLTLRVGSGEPGPVAPGPKVSGASGALPAALLLCLASLLCRRRSAAHSPTPV